MEFLLAVVSCRGETQCVGNVHNVSSTRVAEFDFLSENLDSRCLCTYQCKAGGGGGRAWGGDLIVSVVPGVGHLTDLVLPGEGIFESFSSPDVDIFDCRLGRKRLRPNICFPLPRFTHAPYGLRKIRNSWRPMRASEG